MTVYLDPSDELSAVLTIPEAAEAAGVTVRTVNRWIAAGRLRVLPGRHVVEGEVLAVEAVCWRASRQGRPGSRPKVPA